MVKKYRFQIIGIYAVLAALLIFTAIVPAADLDVSGGLISGLGESFAYSLGNFFEIWAEPVTLVPGAFVMAMGASLFLRQKTKKGIIFGIVAFAGSFACAYQTIYRTVKYYANLEDISKPWLYVKKPIVTDHIAVKIACIAAGIAVAALFVLLANKIKLETLEKTEKVVIMVFFSYLCALIIITVMKHIWGRMRFREYLDAYNSGARPALFTAWFSPQGKPASDGYQSFPSGHTSNALQILPMTFLFDAVGKKKAGRIVRIAAIVWIAFIMFSRIIAGAHYLSDVCGGALISFTVMVVTASIVFGKDKKTEKNKE